ncbi:OPT oligopeptide transporter protein-domain-containing protein [Armillaria novae-zelandiae]|uniref:OPT oligopeptide transporter protein-domain-containing protein n=1 Tax=Armillaria novae-zelandiae TaxID=153914 RepID=A0AA39T9T2_9AGAR|nr:OPT oligopeptide transporter protein-domain-containing protein [Armillaria novae-zelandiae]
MAFRSCLGLGGGVNAVTEEEPLRIAVNDVGGDGMYEYVSHSLAIDGSTLVTHTRLQNKGDIAPKPQYFGWGIYCSKGAKRRRELRTYAGIGNCGGISQERFFLYAFLGSFSSYFLPGYLFQALSYFYWVCWIVPDNVPVNQMFGYVHGMGILTPALYYSKAWDSKNMPISSRGSYDHFGATYDVNKIVNPDTTFNEAAYKEYTPLFISTTFAISYGLSFVPEWRYSIILLAVFAFGVISIKVWNIKFPVQYFILALVISFVYVIPIGMIQAITNQQVGLNVVTELIIGYALPRRPVAMMMFKTWGYITKAQALTFTSDFKLGYYMKIPPQSMFWAQVVTTVIAGTTQLGVQAWMFTNIENLCDPAQKNGSLYPSTEVFGIASIIWGVIGPVRPFSQGQVYYALVFFFLIGFACQVISYLISLKWPNSIIRYVNFPVIFSGRGAIPPASAINYVPWTIVAFIFQYYPMNGNIGINTVQTQHMGYFAPLTDSGSRAVNKSQRRCGKYRNIRLVSQSRENPLTKTEPNSLLLFPATIMFWYRPSNVPSSSI